MMTMENEMTIAEAMAAADAAEKKYKEAEAAASKAKADMHAAVAAINAARLRADAGLPRAFMVIHGRWQNSARQEVAIVRRTQKMVTVKYPGELQTRKFRLNDRNQWEESPRPKSRFSHTWTTLELPEAQKDDE